MRHEKRKTAGDVVELNSQWLQVGGPLANVIGNLQVKSCSKTEARPLAATAVPEHEQQSGDLFAPRKAA